MPLTAAHRDYDGLLHAVASGGDRQARMQHVIDLLWERYGAAGGPGSVSWIGFYTKTPGADEMLLAARRNKPACSPIGLHGACGRGWTSRRSLVITDVAHLGGGYIACDPRDKSELVVPVFESDGACWGVLDADSYDVGAFSREDAAGMQRLMRAAGLTFAEPEGVEVI